MDREFDARAYLVQRDILRGLSTEAPHLIRLGDVLAERGAPVNPILSAVTTAGTSSVYLAASTRSRRIDLLVPFHPDALAAVAPQAAPVVEQPAGRPRRASG